MKAYEERIKDEELQSDYQGTETKLLFNDSNSSSSSKQNSRDSSKGRGKGSNRGCGGGGRGRNQSGQNRGSQDGSNERGKQQGKKDYSKVQCFRCDKFGHFVSRCPEQKKDKQSNFIDAKEIDSSLFKVQDVQKVFYLIEGKIISKITRTVRKKKTCGIWIMA
ncbi:putative transcription factor interactor and regulator CCHC(Zn) family [Helianthus annuus]|nr:putative transcription factor interactor and regulator CCHC(Zn) family [Helianthus annuus]